MVTDDSAPLWAAINGEGPHPTSLALHLLLASQGGTVPVRACRGLQMTRRVSMQKPAVVVITTTRVARGGSPMKVAGVRLPVARVALLLARGTTGADPTGRDRDRVHPIKTGAPIGATREGISGSLILRGHEGIRTEGAIVGHKFVKLRRGSAIALLAFQSMADVDEKVAEYPTSERNLRACMTCKLVKAEAQFKENGCENCPSNQQTFNVNEYTTPAFHG